MRAISLYLSGIQHVDKGLSLAQAIDRTAPHRARRLLPQPRDKIRISAHRDSPAMAILHPPYLSVRGLAQAQCLFENRVEHRFEIAGRGIDNLQNFGGRS